MRTEKVSSGSSLYAELLQAAPGLLGFSVQRVAATVEQPTEGVTLLRCSEPISLLAGKYAILCGALPYEVEVE